MQLTSDLKPSTDFTRVMNEVIFDDRLTHAEFRLWCRLLSLPKGAKSMVVELDEVAKQLGVSASVFRGQRQSLKDKGFLIAKKGRLIVTVPEADFEPKEVKLSPEQQQRHDLRDVWNNSKPETYSRLRHPVAEAQVETLKLHAEHNGQADLSKFLTDVLKGCKADDWWKGKNLNFNNVFGTGVPKQNKFTNVEKLFKLAGSNQGQAALFDKNDDQCWLDWYESKGHAMTKVVRLEMERWDAYDHETDNPEEGTIFVYSHEGDLVHWSLKADRVGVSYLPTAG